VNRGQFFRDVTLRLCSSLDLQTSLERAFPVLVEAFAIDHSSSTCSTPAWAIRRIAHVRAHEPGAGEDRLGIVYGRRARSSRSPRSPAMTS